jgi:hypothetical protein
VGGGGGRKAKIIAFHSQQSTEKSRTFVVRQARRVQALINTFLGRHHCEQGWVQKLVYTVIEKGLILVTPPSYPKYSGLCPYNPSAKEVEGLEVFLYERDHNFELFSNIQDQNLKVITYSG